VVAETVGPLVQAYVVAVTVGPLVQAYRGRGNHKLSTLATAVGTNRGPYARKARKPRILGFMGRFASKNRAHGY
jgi:hypothetical protein